MPAERGELRYRYTSSISEIDGRLHYGPEGSSYLEPCARITDPDLMVGVLDNNVLQPKRFLLTQKDKHPIRLTMQKSGKKFELTHPGKSAFLYFEGDPTRETIGKLTDISLQRVRTRSDHLHLSTVGWIEEAGWTVWWTPLPDRESWIHVRLVSNCTLEAGGLPTLTEATALQETFIKAV